MLSFKGRNPPVEIVEVAIRIESYHVILALEYFINKMAASVKKRYTFQRRLAASLDLGAIVSF